MAKEQKQMFFFDETGDKWEVYDMEGMLEEFLDEDLKEVYVSTRYFHELEMAKLELIKLGLLEQVQGEYYDAAAVVLGADTIAEAIVERLGQDILDQLDSEVDVTWQENKPDLSKYQQRKEDEETEE